jgi:signal transduction histidine kinase
LLQPDTEIEATRPHFLQTPWFFAFSTCAIALASWSAFRWHTQQVRLRSETILGERERIAGELHDTLAQSLAGLALQIESTDQVLAVDTDAARDHLQRARDLVHESLEASRRVIWNLQAEKDLGGLADSLIQLGEPFAGGNGSRVAVVVAGRQRPLPAAVKNHLLRIGQEAVANAVRHGRAQHVRVQLHFEAERILLLVEDDGAGFSMEDLGQKLEGHFGLLGMNERARRLGASLRVDSRLGAGTCVRVELPLEGML